eukprot:6340722-Amphidinium_carterae.1
MLNSPSSASASVAPVPFQVTITDLAGQSVVVETNETMSLMDLHEAVGRVMQAAPYLLRLVLNSSILDPRDVAATVQSLGIVAGSELTVIRRSGFVLDQPGVCRYT